MIVNEHFFPAVDSLHLVNQISSAFKYLCIWTLILIMFLSRLKAKRSSANIRLTIFLFGNELHSMISLINKENKIGDKIAPWGTPVSILYRIDFNSSTCTKNFRFVKNAFIQKPILLGNLLLLNLNKSPLCQTLSNAFKISNTIPQIFSSFSKLSKTLWQKKKMVSVVCLFGLNPDW